MDRRSLMSMVLLCTLKRRPQPLQVSHQDVQLGHVADRSLGTLHVLGGGHGPHRQGRHLGSISAIDRVLPCALARSHGKAGIGFRARHVGIHQVGPLPLVGITTAHIDAGQAWCASRPHWKGGHEHEPPDRIVAITLGLRHGRDGSSANGGCNNPREYRHPDRPNAAVVRVSNSSPASWSISGRRAARSPTDRPTGNDQREDDQRPYADVRFQFARGST